MADERRIREATVQAIERHSRAIDVLTGYLNEASVLVLVFGILDTYSSNKLTIRVGEIVVATAFVLFVGAVSLRLFIYWLVGFFMRVSLEADEAAQAKAAQKQGGAQ